MAFLPAPYTITVWRGGTYRQNLTLFTDTAQTLLWNLTGYTAKMTIHDANNILLYTLDDNNGGTTVGGAAGTIDLYIPATTTATFSWPNALYTLTLQNGSVGDTYPLLFGSILIRTDH